LRFSTACRTARPFRASSPASWRIWTPRPSRPTSHTRTCCAGTSPRRRSPRCRSAAYPDTIDAVFRKVLRKPNFTWVSTARPSCAGGACQGCPVQAHSQARPTNLRPPGRIRRRGHRRLAQPAAPAPSAERRQARPKAARRDRSD